ncbi:MAG: ABC transporter substrate-binding protein [Eubacteriales bacterium]|nr:ABC transporter substrate-binding protein [Eubacteriales bacterium]
MVRKGLRMMIGITAAAALLGGCSAANSGSAESTAAAQEASTEAERAESTAAPESSAAAESAENSDPAEKAEFSVITDAVRQSVDEMVYENADGQMVVSHKYGETVVPENPERIVGLKLEDLMLALGVDMVACQNISGYYLEDEINALNIGTIAVDEESNTVNLEQVLSYEPDLIVIRDSFDQSVYDQLSGIAPTIAFDLQTPVQSILALGKALGMEEQAEARLEQYQAKIVDAREKLSAVDGQEVAMLRIMPKEIRLYPYSSNNMSKFLYDELALTPDPMAVAYDGSKNLAISMESLPDLTAEHIFVIAGYGTASAEQVEAARERYASIQEDPLWQDVPAVKSGNIYEVDSRVWLTHGIIAVERKIDDVLSYLAPENAE